MLKSYTDLAELKTTYWLFPQKVQKEIKPIVAHVSIERY